MSCSDDEGGTRDLMKLIADIIGSQEPTESLVNGVDGVNAAFQPIFRHVRFIRVGVKRLHDVEEMDELFFRLEIAFPKRFANALLFDGTTFRQDLLGSL